MKRLFLAAALAVAICGALTQTAAADSNFHTERIPLTPVGSAALRVGFVVDIHANGPQVFAIERYVLVGASPHATYQVRLQLFGDSAGCAANTHITTVPTATVETNVAGNGVGGFVFRPADAPHNVKVGIVWEFTQNGNVAYTTACIAVTTD
jgi:hypothetical protein